MKEPDVRYPAMTNFRRSMSWFRLEHLMTYIIRSGEVAKVMLHLELGGGSTLRQEGLYCMSLAAGLRTIDGCTAKTDNCGRLNG